MRRSSAIGIAILATVEIAHAAPLAQLSADVDGDGAPDAIELGTDGVVRIGGSAVKLAPAISHGELAVAQYRGQHYVVATITTPTTHEAAILGASGGWHELTQVAVGGVGLDHDYGVAIDATADGIFRYQTRDDIRRCDGKPAYLFADKFDGAKFRRASALPVNVSDAAPVLAAKRDAASASPPLIYQAHAASYEVGAGDAGGLVIPRELDDGQLDTVWHEELAASAGEGQFFTFEPRASDARATELRIVPGNPATNQTWKAGNRVRRIAIVAASGAWHAELPDAAGEPTGTAFVVALPQPVAGCVTVILESTYGPPRGQTAIAELEVFADGERGGGGDAMLARVVADGAAGAANAAAALARRGAAGVTAIEAALAGTTDRAARQRLVGALAELHDPAAAPVLVHAASVGWVRDQGLREVIDALGRLDQGPALHDLAAQSGLALDARVAAASEIGASGFALLVDLLGHGPADVRRAARDRLVATASIEALINAAGNEDTAGKAGDLWMAATTAAIAHGTKPTDRAAVLAAMRAAWPRASDYPRRYRLAYGIAALGDPAALDELAGWLAALPDSAESAAVRQVAVAGVAADPRPGTAGFVIARAHDRDPGVRLAALAALTADDAADADGVLGDAIAHDAWPEIRRRAANALGARCQRPAPARVLTDAVDRDPDLNVRGDALGALVACHARGAAALLARIWNDDKAAVELRSRAVLEAIALGEPEPARALLDRFHQWRGDAINSADSLTLAQSAAAAIGRLHPPGAAHALGDALDDTAFPEIVQAAALALGALGPACPPEAKAKLAQIAQSKADDGGSSAQAASAAKHAAAQCGRPAP